MIDASNNGFTRRGTVYYDDECVICVRLYKRWGRFFLRRGFLFRPISEGKRQTRLPFAPEEFEREMKLQTADGQWYGGVDAILKLFRTVPWLAPLGWLGGIPGLHGFAAACYRRVAANRHCVVKHAR